MTTAAVEVISKKPLDMLLEEELEMWKEKRTIAWMKERRRTSNLKRK